MNKKIVSVTFVGSPNVGKSSLLNRILGRKSSIVSPKPHTTRGQVLGVKNIDQTQIIFLDTPGYMKQGSSVWAECFTATVTSSLEGTDLAVLIIDATRYRSRSTETMLKNLASHENLFVCVNKVDLVKRAELYEIISYITEFGYKDKVHLISAYTGTGVDELMEELLSKAEEGDWLFEDENDAELARHVKAAECVREKAFYCLHEEVPFSMWTRATKWYFRKKPDNVSLQEVFTKACWKVYVDIIVSQESHKRIVVGTGGNMVKQIGVAARTELESSWGPGQLFLNVIVDENWQKNPKKIEEVCYMSTLRNTF